MFHPQKATTWQTSCGFRESGRNSTRSLPVATQCISRPPKKKKNCEPNSTHLWRELARKLLELLQLLANFDRALAVQQKRHNGLCAAGILYGLRRKEQVTRRIVVVGAVYWGFAACLAGRVLEEKDDTIDRTELLQLLGLECGQFLELYVFNAELLD